MASHRTGFASYDMLWYNTNYTSQEIWDRLQYLPFAYEFRADYLYNNIMVSSAGLILSKVHSFYL